MNCSGKHAAMLATCVAAGWPTASYRDPGHPLQAGIRLTIERLAGEQVQVIGVDGCGAPLFGLTLTGLARAFGALVLAEPGSAERRVADAMRAHPKWTSGTKRPDRELVEAVPGLLLKSGADGVEAFALADGRCAAFKIDDGDGARRARTTVSATLLRTLGAGALPGADPAVLDTLARPPVFGGGRPVGETRATLPFLGTTGTSTRPAPRSPPPRPRPRACPMIRVIRARRPHAINPDHKSRNQGLLWS
jgi:L-asparaginase II